jgi:hypothetical protein
VEFMCTSVNFIFTYTCILRCTPQSRHASFASDTAMKQAVIDKLKEQAEALRQKAASMDHEYRDSIKLIGKIEAQNTECDSKRIQVHICL